MGDVRGLNTSVRTVSGPALQQPKAVTAFSSNRAALKEGKLCHFIIKQVLGQTGRNSSNIVAVITGIISKKSIFGVTQVYNSTVTQINVFILISQLDEIIYKVLEKAGLDWN